VPSSIRKWWDSK